MIGEIGQLLIHNMFVYCLNNPVNMEDQLGTNGVFSLRDPIKFLLLLITSCTVAINGVYYKSNQKRKPVNLPSFKKMTAKMNHILSGHTPNGNRNPKGKKDVFWGMSATAIEKAIEEAYNTCEKLQTQGNRILVSGYSSTYRVIIEMWVNVKDKVIETAYPK